MDTKRAYSQVAATPEPESDKKQHTKPGRKPIDTEPKSKRTAQNRAAQRAYRERKERKMKDLEDKVAGLEDEKIKAATELDLLRAQIDLLKRELLRYRGHLDFSDLAVSKSENSTQQRLPETTPSEKIAFSSAENMNSLLNDLSASQLPDLVSGSSSSTSPLNDNVIVLPDSAALDRSAPIVSSLSPHNQFNVVDLFDEQVDPFCVNLNEACGTRQKPTPKHPRTAGAIPPLEDDLLAQWNTTSPFHTLFTPSENLSDPFFADPAYNVVDQDPLLFLNDNNFDVLLAFGNATNDVVEHPKSTVDPLAGLTSEESAYDPLGTINTDFNFNEFVKSSLPSETSSRHSVADKSSSATSYRALSSSIAEKDEVVPAPPETIRCSEIWDRITSHPRYTEIDIDGLCSELKSKAKCSEKGVVLDVNDVNKLIERSAMRR